jgi:hypothetical protein
MSIHSEGGKWHLSWGSTGRYERSATPTIDAATTHKGFAPMRKNGAEQ